MTSRLTHQLAPKPKGLDPAYSLEEMVGRAGPDIRDAYEASHRMVLALQQLKKAVEHAVANGQHSDLLFPQSAARREKMLDTSFEPAELCAELSEERHRFHKGKISPHYSRLRKLAHDPLLMARKHVVDVMKDLHISGELYPDDEPDIPFMYELFDPYDLTYRLEHGSSVTHLMMLMADNAKNHAKNVQVDR